MMRNTESRPRKILAGAIVMAKMQQGVMEDALVRQWLGEALTRADRGLFNLPAKA